MSRRNTIPKIIHVQLYLQQQIDAMIDPENDIDPVIAAYESIPIKQTRGIWKYTKICKEGEATAT